MADRRRNNGPIPGTRPPIYDFMVDSSIPLPLKLQRTRAPEVVRNICKSAFSKFIYTPGGTFANPKTHRCPADLKSGLIPPASGSAYFEQETTTAAQQQPPSDLLPIHRAPSLKLSAIAHGPRPLPRSAAFAPHLTLSCSLKYAPFAAPPRIQISSSGGGGGSGGAVVQLQQYARDAGERGLVALLESALRGVIIGERFPKSGLDLVVTVLEGGGGAGGLGEAADESGADQQQQQSGKTKKQASFYDAGGWDAMNILSGAVTAASMALIDAGIDVLDSVVGGVAALVQGAAGEDDALLVLDPNPLEHRGRIRAACTVGYIASRDELPLIWIKGETRGGEAELLIDAAVKAALSTKRIVDDGIREGFRSKQ